MFKNLHLWDAFAIHAQPSARAQHDQVRWPVIQAIAVQMSDAPWWPETTHQDEYQPGAGDAKVADGDAPVASPQTLNAARLFPRPSRPAIVARIVVINAPENLTRVFIDGQHFLHSLDRDAPAPHQRVRCLSRSWNWCSYDAGEARICGAATHIWFPCIQVVINYYNSLRLIFNVIDLSLAGNREVRRQTCRHLARACEGVGNWLNGLSRFRS